jgi:hypothetical protein
MTTSINHCSYRKALVCGALILAFSFVSLSIPVSLGQAGDPFVITNVNDLQAINNNLTAYYVLGNDIDASATIGWNGGAGFIPIGTLASGFTGSFDGKGYKIFNLYINRPSTDYVGLFGYVGSGGVVKNVGLESESVRGKTYVGGLVGRNSGTVDNCYSTGSVSGTTSFVGGLVGCNDYGGTVSKSCSTGTVSGGSYVGGLVGINSWYGTASNCYSTGAVNGNQDVGGFVGYNNHGTASNCYSTGSVRGDSTVGGLVGRNYGPVSNCYSTGSVTGSTTEVGGLVGRNYYGTVSNCYSTGSVSGTTNYVGGLVGRNTEGTVPNTGTVSNSFWDINTSKQSSSAAGTGKTTAEMKDIGTYAGWDFGGVWGMNPNNNDGYPFLLWEGYNHVYPNTPKNLSPSGVQPSGTTQVTLSADVTDSYGDSLTVCFYDASDDSLIGNDQHVPSGGSASVTWGGLSTGEYSFYARSYSESRNVWGEFSLTQTFGIPLPGSGTQADPYRISDVVELQLMRNYVLMNDINLTAHYVLMNNIDASATIGWNGGAGFIPVGTLASGFTWSFDGKGYKIFNLYINRPSTDINRPSTDYVGLFGYVGSGGVVKNVGLESVNVVGNSYVGGLVGLNDGTVSNSYSTGSVSGTSHVGGLVGMNDGTVDNSYSTGSVSGSGEAIHGYQDMGGLVGMNDGTVDNSYSTGSVSGDNYVGGLVGYNNHGTVNNSYSTGSVSGTTTSIGGLVGYNGDGATVSNSYSTGSVSGTTTSVGGLVGRNTGAVSNSYSTGSVSGTSYVGGLVGRNYVGTISNCYSTGSVSGSGENVGGLAGGNYAGTVSNSFWDYQTSKKTTSQGGTGKTTENMKNVRTFTDTTWSVGLTTPWDFMGNPHGDVENENIWGIHSSVNNGYPFLAILEAENIVVPTVLIVSPSSFTIPPSSFTILTATLKDNANNPLAGKVISWSSSSGTISPTSGTTNSYGQISVTYTAPSYETTVTVTASFGDNQYRSSRGYSYGTITVAQRSTTLSIVPSSFTLQPGNRITLTATLKDNANNPLAGKTITWTKTTGSLSSTSGTTNSSGQVSVTYTAPSYETTVTVTASFAGDNQYGTSNGNSSGTIVKASTILIITPSVFTLQPRNSTTLTVTLTSNGSPLVGKTLTWSAALGEIVPSVGSTNSSGQVIATYAAPSYENSVVITATFAGDNIYQASSGSSSGTIESSPPLQALIKIEPSTLQIGFEGNWVTCYIEISTDNVSRIDVSSILLEGRIQVDPTAPIEIGDYDNNSAPDLMVKFNRQSVENIVAPGIVSLTVTGNVGESRFFGTDKIDVINLDSGALVSAKSVSGGAPEVKEEVYNLDLNIATQAGDNKVTVSVSSEISTGTTIVINIDNTVVPISSLGDLKVLVDNREIRPADDYADILDTTNENEPEYLILFGAEGIQVLVSIPHFSTHTITVGNAAAMAPPQPPEEVIISPAGGISLPVVLAIVVVAVMLIISAAWISHRHAFGEATSELFEYGLSSMSIQEADIFRVIKEQKKFSIPELMHKTGASNTVTWRTVQKLIKKGLVEPTEEVKAPATGRGKPSTVYKYVGD